MNATTPFPMAATNRAAEPATAATTPISDDRRVAAAALASLDRMYPQYLRALWKEWNDPRAIVDAIRSGRCAPVLAAAGRRDAETLVRTWRKGLDLEATEQRLRARNTHVYLAGEPDFPFEVEFEDGPVVLFGEGDRPDALRRPRVGVVGTRAATPHGLADAHELGRELAQAGVTVVSGLAIGIDGA
ncbi:MAG: DNA-processing protein DprA, partial [Acidimicrobiia bacterium]